MLGLEEEEKGSRNRVLVELELLVCKTRLMVGNTMKTGGKVLLTVLLGITGKIKLIEQMNSVEY